MDVFYAKLLLSFVTGGSWIALVSVAAERFGGDAGGFIAGMPSTAVVALFFIAFTQGPVHAAEAITIFPLCMAIYAVFLAAYAALAPRGFLWALGLAVLIWCGLQALLFFFCPGWMPGILAVTVAVFSGSLIFVNRLGIPRHAVAPIHSTAGRIMLRALASGAIVAMAVLGSRFGGPALGGILSGFPAVAISALVIMARSAGVGLTRAMVRPMIISGVINCTVFALVFRHAVLSTHLLTALAVSYAAAMASGACTFFWIRGFGTRLLERTGAK